MGKGCRVGSPALANAGVEDDTWTEWARCPTAPARDASRSLGSVPLTVSVIRTPLALPCMATSIDPHGAAQTHPPGSALAGLGSRTDVRTRYCSGRVTPVRR